MAEVVSVSSISTADIVEVVVEKYLLPTCHIEAIVIVDDVAVVPTAAVFSQLLLFFCCCCSDC